MAAAATQAELYEQTVVEGRSAPAPGPASSGERETRLLLDAAYLAAGNGADAVVWAGPAATDQQQQIELDALAMLHSRALLVERLVGLERPGGAREFRVHVPYADLTDRQIADLILDMDLPIWSCWWWALGRGPRGTPEAEAARLEYERWQDLLREAGWREGMPGPATIN